MGRSWSVQLTSIASVDGEAEPAAEQAFWPEEGQVDPSETDVVVDLRDPGDEPSDAPRVHLVLKRVQ